MTAMEEARKAVSTAKLKQELRELNKKYYKVLKKLANR